MLKKKVTQTPFHPVSSVEEGRMCGTCLVSHSPQITVMCIVCIKNKAQSVTYTAVQVFHPASAAVTGQ